MLFQELRRNGRKHSSSDSYNDHIALLVMDNIKKLQKLPFAHKSSAQSMTSSNGTRDSGTTVSSSVTPFLFFFRFEYFDITVLAVTYH